MMPSFYYELQKLLSSIAYKHGARVSEPILTYDKLANTTTGVSRVWFRSYHTKTGTYGKQAIMCHMDIMYYDDCINCFGRNLPGHGTTLDYRDYDFDTKFEECVRLAATEHPVHQ